MSQATDAPYRLDLVPLADLRADPANPKAHDVPLLAGSLARHGYIDPIVRDDRTGYLISGHGRTTALREAQANGEAPPRGIAPTADGADWLVPVVTGWASSDDLEARAALVTLNRTGEVGGWVDASLLAVLEALREVPAGLAATGYSAGEVEDLRALLADVPALDDLASDWDGETGLAPRPLLSLAVHDPALAAAWRSHASGYDSDEGALAALLGLLL